MIHYFTHEEMKNRKLDIFNKLSSFPETIDELLTVDFFVYIYKGIIKSGVINSFYNCRLPRIAVYNGLYIEIFDSNYCGINSYIKNCMSYI